MKKQDMFDMSMLDNNAGAATSSKAATSDPEFNKNYAIGSRIQRSMSAPPVAEHVSRLPPPMYAQSEYDDSKSGPNMHTEYYHIYAPKWHNPRLPISYNSWEAMQKQYQSRNAASSLHRVQISELRRSEDPLENPMVGMTTTSSQEDFEAAVAAVGGHSYHKVDPQDYCLSPTESSDSNSSSSIRPMGKTLIDRIQEDFPRTPSPVFGYGMPPPSQMGSLDDPHPIRPADPVRGHSHAELPSDFLQSMKRFQVPSGEPRERMKSRMNVVAPSYHPQSMYAQHPMHHFGGNCGHHPHIYPPYDRYARGMPPNMHCPSDMHYRDSYDPHGQTMPDIRMLSKGYYEQEHPHYARQYVPAHHHPAAVHSAQWSGDLAHEYAYHGTPHSIEDNQSDPIAYHHRSVMEKPKAQPQSQLSAQQPQRSVLLEDFRATIKTKKWELVDARGHIVEFAKDQHGSRFIQLKLETAKADIKDIVFSEIFPVALALMTDVFGNYVIQKFFDHGNLEHVMQLMRVIQGRMLDLALQMYGCRVIQKALESKQHTEKLDLICELQGHVLKCVKDQNGNHVIQKCIEILPWKDATASRYMERAAFLLASFVGNVSIMATHPYGCRVIQRVLENCSDAQMTPILHEIQDACALMVEDQYGNYVIQHVLEHSQPAVRSALINKIYPDIVRFSYHKYASNVIEKCLLYASVDQLRVIMRHVMDGKSPAVECPLQVMMKDQYANYVVQKLIDVADASERDKMASIIKTQASVLKRFTFGKHILNRLEKLTGQKII
ncbi:Aste57867_13784 [Aphanomyces stellatus]|uniref:Aste57867_13784 protein n=1 Tax=Aphanomyces stellatus TaxID=120398 RepID=A0A485KZD8_9STRA|nr:hypothetical protein As57867_013734 [Aphanomyces stellatus]VFT90616.1 Aste57867_13784 [Aphanomyces stellatus]